MWKMTIEKIRHVWYKNNKGVTTFNKRYLIINKKERACAL